MSHEREANETVKWEKNKVGGTSGWKSRKEDRRTIGGGEKDRTEGTLRVCCDSSHLPDRPGAAANSEAGQTQTDGWERQAEQRVGVIEVSPHQL